MVALFAAIAGCGCAPAPAARSAPTVSRPVDAGPFLAKPCDLLSGDQLAKLGIRPRGEPSAGTWRPGTICTWIDDSTNNVLNAQWMVSYRNGLSDLYRERDRQAYFEETAVGGFPAVFTGVKDQRAIGECDLEIGTSERDVLRVGFALPLRPEGKPCDFAKQAATAMLDTLTHGT
jgi:Protein of unknown function (DUF3558)